jgi:dienelactone hydrolase
MLTSMTALERLYEISSKVSWMPEVNPRKVVFAGHSMGGHGAWQLATHYPDSALAVVSAAGWISKEDYGDSNLFFRHDIGVSFTDMGLKAILEDCVAENMADLHISNLRGIPVLARIGAIDRTVHPYYVRRMVRLLEQEGVNVSYAELPEKEHWWWDTWSENDGGVNSDPAVRKFIEYYTVPIPGKDSKRMVNSQCHKNEEGCSSMADEWKYGVGGTMFSSEPGRLMGHFVLTVINPSSHDGLRGVRVILQHIPMRISKVEIVIQTSSAVLQTSNVKMLQLESSPLAPVQWQRMTSIMINGNNVTNISSPATSLCFYQQDDGSWTLVSNSHVAIALSRYGPARRVAESQFLIVVGTAGDDIAGAVMQMALYIANLFHLTSDTLAPIVTEKEARSLQDGYNLIILGLPEDNGLLVETLLSTPISYDNKEFSLGDCRFSSSHTGVATLAFHSRQRQALILTGNSVSALKDIVHLATPTIPPMTRSPVSQWSFYFTSHSLIAF